MTSLPSARKRAQEFADAVDAVLAGAPVTAGGATTALLDVVVALREVPDPVPRPEFTTDLRRQLVSEAAALAAPRVAVTAAATGRVPAVWPTTRTWNRHHGRLVAAATALVVVGGTAGVATASQRALPGDALYTVKRALESAEVRLATSDDGRGHDLLAQASSRLDEVQALLPSSKDALTPTVAARLPQTVRDFTAQAVEGSGLLLDSYERDNDPAAVVEVRSFAARSVGTLRGLATFAPTSVLGDLAGAATAIQAVDARAVALCPTCGDGSPPVLVPPGLDDVSPAGEDEVEGSGDPGDPQASPVGAGSPTDDPAADGPGEDGTVAGLPGPSAPLGEDPSAPTDAAGDPSAGDSGSDSGSASGSGSGSSGSADPSGGATGGTDDPTDGAAPGPSQEVTDDPTDVASPPAEDPTDPADPTDPDDAAGGLGSGTGGGAVSGGDQPSDPGGSGGSGGPGDNSGPGSGGGPGDSGDHGDDDQDGDHGGSHGGSHGGGHGESTDSPADQVGIGSLPILF